MKKIYFLILFFAPLLEQANAQCNTVFFDNFESGSYSPTWTIGSGLSSGSVTSTNPASGSYRLEGVGGTSTHLTGFSSTIPAATPATISWYIFPTGSVSTNYFVCGNSAVTANNCLVFCYWYGASSQIRFVTTSASYNYPATPGQWYHIELRNINYVNRTFDIYIDNVQVQTAFAFRSTTLSDVSRIHLYNYNFGTGVWDQVTLGTIPVTLSAAVSNTSCAGTSDGSIDLSVVTGTPNYSYLWSSSDTTEDITGLSAGTYSVVVTDTNTCAGTASFAVASPPPLVANAGADTAICQGQSIQLGGSPTATGGTPSYTYSWTPGPFSGPNPVDTPSSNMVYNVVITDSNNCSATASVSVTINPLPLPVISWSGDTLFANAAGIIFQWNLNGNPVWTNGTGYYVTTTPGDYTVVVTSSDGCTGTSSIYTLTPTSIESEIFNSAILIYPNPVTNELRIQSAELKIEEMEIHNVMGELILEQQTTNNKQQTFDVSLLPSGIYFVKVKTDKGMGAAKFVKQ